MMQITRHISTTDRRQTVYLISWRMLQDKTLPEPL